jgi:hypothetical protein
MTGCVTAKKSWPTWEEAEAVLQKIQSNPRTKVVPQRVYQCPWCDQYHLTSDPKEKL